MSESATLLVLGALGALAAWVERRDGWRHAALAERLSTEIAHLRERVACLEAQSGDRQAQPARAQVPWWAFWRRDT